MTSGYIKLPVSGGGGGAVDSVNGQTGVVVLTASDIGGGTANTFAGFDGSGDFQSIPGFSLSTDVNGFLIAKPIQPDNDSGFFNVHSYNGTFNPLQNSPNETWSYHNTFLELDTGDSGFTFGTSGNALTAYNVTIKHYGTGESGSLSLFSNNFDIGNGTDPVAVRGLGYSFGFGTVNANATIKNGIQGYGFQLNVNASATLDSATSYTNAFYDFANYATASNSYVSYTASPIIEEIRNNNGYSGLNINPTIDTFTGNAGFTGVGIAGDLGTFGTGGFNGLNVNPNIDLINTTAYGIFVSMDNVTLYAGAQSSLVEQDITYTWIQAGDNDVYTLEYVDDTTAGNESVTIAGTDVTVHIESGVSTATQVKTAWDASQAASAVNAVITGTAGDAQVAFGPTNFTGGENPGTKKAAYLDGDVEITGSLQFGGALSIGQLNAFYSAPLVSSPGQPTSTHLLISAPTVAANATVSSADFLGVNTACLMQFGDNSTVTTDFLGVAALGLPAVASFGTGATVDRVSGATFALSLDASSTGGTIDRLALCRAISIPNGITAVTRQYGYAFDLPFGDPATTTWGVYISPDCNNFLKGSLKIGGIVDSTDVVTNDSVALEVESTTKAVVFSRMTTTERDALTAINGMVIYNTTDDKLQVRAAGSWVDLH